MFALKHTLSLVLVFGSFGAAHGQQQAVASGPDDRTLIAGYNRSIDLLTTGIRQKWSAEQYAKAFGLKTGPESERVRVGFSPCAQQVNLLLKPRTIWDERPPLEVEVYRTLGECRSRRDVLVALESARPADSAADK